MILVGNGKLYTRDTNHPYEENGAVAIDGDTIREVGTYAVLKEKYKDASLLDARGKIIMPGFINAHEHIYSAFARGLSLPGRPPKNFLEILDGTWWHLDRQLLLENTYYSAVAVYLECIRYGVTTVFDHHASYGAVTDSLFMIAKAAEEFHVRTSLAYEVSDRDGEEKMKASVNENRAFLEYAKTKNSDMLNGLFGLHASFTLSDSTLDYVKEQNTCGAGYHVHVAEGQYDAEHCREHYEISVVERLQKFGILGSQSVAGHCIHIDDSDLEILKETDTAVVHNPESNMGNAVGAPDVFKLLDRGILTGLGTDGYTNDMLESLKVANILQKHLHGMPDRGFGEACTLLFENNAEIANRYLRKKTGILKPGAYADIILVDYDPVTPLAEENLNGHLMFGMQGAMTDTTIINGKVLMKDKKMLSVDVEELHAKCRESAKELWKRL